LSKSSSPPSQLPPSTGQSPLSTGQSIPLDGSSTTNSISTEQILSSDKAATIDNNISDILKSEDSTIKKDSDKKYLKRPFKAHLNINSLKSKYLKVQETLKRKLVDIFILSETKLDDSFNSNINLYNGYKVDRRDCNKFGGGILVYSRDDLPFPGASVCFVCLFVSIYTFSQQYFSHLGG
jgi:hypothetical protein